MTLYKTYFNSYPLLNAFERDAKTLDTVYEVLKSVDSKVMMIQKMMSILTYPCDRRLLELVCTVERPKGGKSTIRCSLESGGSIRHKSETGWIYLWDLSGTYIGSTEYLGNIIDVRAQITLPDGNDHFII